MQEQTMSRGQRGNKEAKKPKKASSGVARAVPPASATPNVPGVVAHPFKRK
jgi:hypothetical protein